MYKIGDFSKRVNVPIKTLRYYDEIDLFKPSYIDDFTGYRYYQDNQIETIKKIIMLKELNLSLKEIDEYMKTEDICILENKEKEFRLKVEAIKSYVEEVSYELIKGDYGEYIKWNGLRYSDTPAALELRDNVAVYYILLKNGKFKDDFLVFPQEDNSTTLNKMVTDENEFVFCLNFLKKDYKYLTMTSCETTDNSANRIRKLCNVIDENVKQQKGWDGRIWKFVEHKISFEEDEEQ